jgi:ribosomal protein L4
LDVEKPDTKAIDKLIKDIGLSGDKVLVVYDSKMKDSKSLVKSLSNLTKVNAINVGNLNSYKVMNTGKLLFTKEAVKELEERLK